MPSLALAAAALLVLLVAQPHARARMALYVFAGVAIWVFVLKSGVHATLAGVALAMMVPLRRKDGSPFIHDLEEGLHAYVKFLILPLFAFANAGIPLDGFDMSKLTETLPFGIEDGPGDRQAAGHPRRASRSPYEDGSAPAQGCSWRHMAGVSCLAGIGFTMSLFIGSLAFESPALTTSVRIGVIVGSVISTALGVTILMTARLRVRTPAASGTSAHDARSRWGWCGRPAAHG